MARPVDARSPSPTGTAHSSSRRSRKEDDRNRRDEDRPHRRYRSRSRSPQRNHRDDRDRERDRDLGNHRRRDRSVDRDRDRDHRRDKDRERDRDRDRHRSRRDEDDYYRSSRHERSRSRRRSRDRVRDRDSGRLSPPPESRSKRERSPDREKRREGSADSRKRKREEDDHRGHTSKRSVDERSQDTSKHVTPTKADHEKAARLRRLEEWKKKQTAKQPSTPASPTPLTSPHVQLDGKIQTESPNPGADAPPPPVTIVAKPVIIEKKRALSSDMKKPLGADAMLGSHVSDIKKANSITANTLANATTKSGMSKLKAKGNLSGFNISGGKADVESAASKKGLDLEEDEDNTRTLEKIKPEVIDSTPDISMNGREENEEDEDEADEDEESALASARAAAEERSRAERTEDTTMMEAPQIQAANVVEEEEDEDPLDAFMSNLTAKHSARTNFKADASRGKNVPRLQEPEALFSDDEGEPGVVQDDDGVGGIMAKAEEIARKKKKDIGTVNHSKVNYEPFRKNFYTESIDLQDLDEDQVNELRMSLDNIKVRGVDVPKPAQSWAQCGLGVQALEVVHSLGFEAPTSIQAQAIPAIMSGRDVIGVAKTGSGKTIAFLLPIFRHIKDQRPLEGVDGPIGLILSPTRELATQIHKECKPFLKALGLRAVCAYGGAPIKDQIAELKRGAEIVVCTPGRMIDLLAANGGRVTNLRRITYCVLDEADRMFDMGFEPQVMKILANIRPDRQTVLFSATFPRQMEALARKTLKDPIEIIVGGRSVVAPEIEQIVEVRNGPSKFVRLLELLGRLYEDDSHSDDRALIFMDRQDTADLLLRDLMKKGYPCMSIHGGKDQIDRDSTISDFKNGVVPILIATSVAARGLDVKQLKLVVNYDCPNHLEDYVHRAGRTGRAGNKGTAVTFITEDQDRYAVDIAKALTQSGQPVPEAVQKLVDGFREKVKAGKEKAYAGGFSGKGLERFDAQRDAEKARERKGFKVEGEEEAEEADEEGNKKSKVDEEIFTKAASSVAARDAPTPVSAPPVQPPSSRIPGVPDHIDLDGAITVHKTERPAPTGTSASPAQNKLDAVARAAAMINGKLSRAGTLRSGVPIDNKGPDAGAFHATLEINDFPQRGRWAVTNRTNVAKILEATGTSITTKGSFYSVGKAPQEGEEPKLYILVEGDTEQVVQSAMRELMRLLKEGTLAAAEGGDRGISGPGSAFPNTVAAGTGSGRYSIV